MQAAADAAENALRDTIRILKDSDLNRAWENIHSEMRIQSPLLVFYFGERAKKAHGTIFSGLSGVWRAKANYLRFFEVNKKDGSVSPVSGDGAARAGDFDDSFAEVFSPDAPFADKINADCYGIADTADFCGADELYDFVTGRYEKITPSLPGGHGYSWLLIILNDTRAYCDCAADPLLKKNRSRRPFDNVLFLNNTLADGTVLRDVYIEQNYRLIKNVMLMSLELPSVRGALMNASWKTAALSVAEKPDNDIAVILLESAVSNIISALCSGGSAPAAELQKKFGLGRGIYDLADSYYNSDIFRYPSDADIDKFPASAPTANLHGIANHELKKLTMGSWELFVKNFAAGAANTENIANTDWERYYDKFLAEAGTAPTLRDLLAISESAPEQWLRTEADVPSPAKPRDYIKEQLHKNFDGEISSRIRKAVLKKRRAAADYLASWSALGDEISKKYSVNDLDVKRQYGDIVNAFFCDRDGIEYIKALLGNTGQPEDCRESLKRVIGKICESHEIFREAFDSEWQRRLGRDSGVSAQNAVYEKLCANLNKTMRYYPAAAPQPRLEFIYIMLGIDKTRPNSLYHTILKSLQDNTQYTVAYYNTGRGDTAESVAVYKL